MSKVVSGKTFKKQDEKPPVHPLIPLIFVILLGLAMIGISWGVMEVNTKMQELQQQQLEEYNRTSEADNSNNAN